MVSSTNIEANGVIIGTTLVAFTMAAPAACCMAWLVQWAWVLCNGSECNPHESKHRLLRWIAKVSPYLYGWCTMDVLFCATATACSELDLTVQWIVQAKAGSICDWAQHAVGEPCVHVAGSLGAGAICAAMFSVTSAFLFVLTLTAWRPGPQRMTTVRAPDISHNG